MPPRPDEPGREDRSVRPAVTFALVIAVVGVAFLVLAALSGAG